MNSFDLAEEIIFLGCEADEIIKDADMGTLRSTWLILSGYHKGAARARKAAEEREIGLLVVLDLVTRELQRRLDE